MAGVSRADVRVQLTLAGRPITGPGVDRAVVFQGDDSLFNWLRSIDNVAFGPRMRGHARASSGMPGVGARIS